MYLKIKLSCKTIIYHPITAEDNTSLVRNKAVCTRLCGTSSKQYTFEHIQLYSHLYLKKLVLTMWLLISNG